IQLAIPGFRGYRKREDLRIADSLLRVQLAEKIKTDVSAPLENAREAAAKALNLDVMNDIGDLISKVNLAEAKVRHAEQGYSGISPNYRIDEDQLEILYDYDLSMINLVNSLSGESEIILSYAEAGDFSLMKSSCSQAKKNVVDFLNTFKQRHTTMANLGAF
ncbi:MAG: hypothetical protein PHV39_06630, partial [Methanomicrobium sp.]|nr:hypothetical protein [Methanomicrobium sp.]